jgi:hypothetical protein
MRTLEVAEISIQEDGRLLIRPREANDWYQHIYRAAAEVSWDAALASFVCPAPREWSHLRWFQHARDALRSELGCDLEITERTSWKNVGGVLREQISTASVAKW